jgi:LssY C-terminus
METAKVNILIALVAAAVCLPPTADLQQPAVQTAAQRPAAPTTKNAGASSRVTVDASQQWVDTNIDLNPGEKVKLTASGDITYPQEGKTQERKFGPEGLPRSFKDVIRQYPVADGSHGALVGRVGPPDSGQPFLVGAGKEFVAPVAGRLFLGINQSTKDAAAAQGSFQVTINVLEAGAAGATAGPTVAGGGLAETNVPSLTSDLLEKIPRRVTDQQGNPGDMVNVLIVGTEDQMVQAFTTAGWVKVDASVESTVLSGVLSTLEKKDYLTLPMSKLFLFQRPQDYGFAHAEAVTVAMSRHHLRAWKSPYQVDGRPLWTIAATHDIGFERDQRNNKITHRIDPAIDSEREYVNTTLSGTGLVTQRTHVTPANPLKEAKTATGGSFNSDGRILVLVLVVKNGKN